jgi:ABC-type enterochelin transport system substrate-binding protein
MKSAYELAMERLNKSAPTIKLTATQKKEIAELESQTAAKIAGREIAMSAEIAKADSDIEKVEELRQNLAHERKKLQAELEEKKVAVRRNKSRG